MLPKLFHLNSAALKYLDNINILTCKGTVPVEIDNIVRIEAISNYSKLFFSDGKTLVVAKLLRYFEELLSDKQFIRIHRTHIVNRSFISTYVMCTISSARGCKVILQNGDCIDIAKRKKTYFLKSWCRPTA